MKQNPRKEVMASMERNEFSVPLQIVLDGKLNINGLPSAVFEKVEALLDPEQVYEFEIGFIAKE